MTLLPFHFPPISPLQQGLLLTPSFLGITGPPFPTSEMLQKRAVASFWKCGEGFASLKIFCYSSAPRNCFLLGLH